MSSEDFVNRVDQAHSLHR